MRSDHCLVNYIGTNIVEDLINKNVYWIEDRTVKGGRIKSVSFTEEKIILVKVCPFENGSFKSDHTRYFSENKCGGMLNLSFEDKKIELLNQMHHEYNKIRDMPNPIRIMN